MARATVTDTYVAALQHDLADVPDGSTLVGVVRNPTPWFHAAVDENVPALGPPEDLLEEAKRVTEDFEMRGLCAEGAHNAAWDDVDFERRYRAHLEESDDVRSALATLEDRLSDGEPLTLVCFENTEKKRCHRTILREELEDPALAAEG